MIHHVFANKSNIGDWLSAIGVQSLLAPYDVSEHLCDEPFVEETLGSLSDATAQDFIVVGGGGLFMDYFSPFWEGFQGIAQRVPFCIWGVGYCDLKRENSRVSNALLTHIIRHSRICVVRDNLSREYLRHCRLPPAIPCPAMVAVATSGAQGSGLLHVDAYDNVGPAVYRKMTTILKAFAARTSRRYRQNNNLIPAGNRRRLDASLALYEDCDLVVSSRLHGCILGLALGRKVLAVSGDNKLESFMQAAGLGEWVLDTAEIDRLPERLAKLHAQETPDDFVHRARRENRELAVQVKSWIEKAASGPGTVLKPLLQEGLR